MTDFTVLVFTIGFFIVDRSLPRMSCNAEMNDSGSSLSDMEISINPEIIIVSRSAKLAKMTEIRPELKGWTG